jgi:hypothetical protein
MLSGAEATNYLVLNQAYTALDVKGKSVSHNQSLFAMPGQADAFIALPLDPDDPPLNASDRGLQRTDRVESASTGAFLSNESFFRVATLRDNAGRGNPPVGNKRTLPMGHFHLPLLDNIEDTTIQDKLVNGVKEFFRRVLVDVTRDLAKFPPFKYTKPERNNGMMPIEIYADNSASAIPVQIERIELHPETEAKPRFTNTPLPNLPLLIDKGSKQLITKLTFTPPPPPAPPRKPLARTYSVACIMFGANDLPLFRTDVVVKYAPPQIDAIKPTTAKVNAGVTINGKHFVPRSGPDMVKVKFGTIAIMNPRINDTATQIDFNVPLNTPLGDVDITVETPYGKGKIKFTVTA